jgi:hypothetical protein
MRVSVKTALEMFAAIQQLDSYPDGDKSLPCKYDGATRIALAGARRRLRAIQEDFMEARNAALMEVTDGAGELPAMSNGQYRDPEERRKAVALHVAFAVRERELLLATVELELEVLPVAKLNLEENLISAGTLELLGGLVEM